MVEEWRNVGIYRELEKRSEKVPRGKILIGKIEEIIPDAVTLLNRVSDTFPEYTLHDKTHSVNVLKFMDRIIPDETLEQMNELELAILILSAFLHDIGMVASKREKKKMLQSEDFKSFKEKYTKINRSLKKAQEEGNYQIASQLENQLLAFYLRETHADRGAKFIEKKFRARLKCQDLDFSEIVCKVCRSHGEPWEKLGVRKERLHGYPLREEYPTTYSLPESEVNVQYLAIILRLADILDFDRERTPSILFEYLYPISDISLKHWLTHLSVKGWSVRKDKVKYRVECEHPLYQRAVYDFLDKVDVELQGAKFLVERFPIEIAEKYKLHLPMAVDRSEVGPKIIDGKPSYIYGDFQFSLDYDRVIALLSEELHYEKIVAIRELLQNSVDACKQRAAIEKTLGTDWDKRKARIHFKYDSSNHMLTVEDNGIGMDQEIVRNHFLRVGCSYFSKENPRYLRDIALFREKGVTFYPISKFGIGILSCFMLADQMEVRTRRKETTHLCNPLCIKINPELKMYVIRELEPADWHNGTGTIITLRLNKSIDLEKAIEQFAINLPFNISMTINGKPKTIRPRGFGLRCFPEVKKRISDHLKEKGLVSYPIDFSKSQIKGIRGKTTLFFPCLRGKALIPSFDRIRLDENGPLYSCGLYDEFSGGARTLTTCQGFHVPDGLTIRLPIPHITVVDFFGESTPGLTLDRNGFREDSKQERGLVNKRLYDVISSEIRSAISNNKVSFYSPFWRFLWVAEEGLQSLFLRDRKARIELLELPLQHGEEKIWLSYEEIRKRFEEGVCSVFRRYMIDKHREEMEFGNYSFSPPNLPLLAIPPNYEQRHHELSSSLDHFWRELFAWSELTLVENENYYYLKIQLGDQVNPIHEKIVRKLLRPRILRLAEYSGIQSGTLYSNNFARALNIDHPIIRLFLSCLDKAGSYKELKLMTQFADFLTMIHFARFTSKLVESLGRELKKQGLISGNATRLFKMDSIHIRNVKEMSHLFREPVPFAYRYGWGEYEL